MDPEPSGHVRVHRRAADVLATLLDDQHVDRRERQRGYELTRVVEQLALGPASDVVGSECLDPDDLAGGRLDGGNTAEQTPGAAQGVDAAQQPVAHLDRTTRVDLGGAGLLAEADDRHLRAAALDRAVEAGMRLDAVDGQYPVGARCVPVEVERHAVGCAGDLDGLHRRPDLRADRVRRHTEFFDHLALALCSCAAVTAHRGHHEWLCAQITEALDGAAHHVDTVAEAAAAGADRNRHAGGHVEREPFDDRGPRRLGDVADSRWARHADQHLVQLRHDEPRVERQVDALRQLFPRVH